MSMDTNSWNSLDCWYYPCQGQSWLRWVRSSSGIEFVMMTTVSARWVLSNTPNELISCQQRLWDKSIRKNWLPWDGATTKHYRLPPVTNGRTTQLAASLTCSCKLGGEPKQRREEGFSTCGLISIDVCFPFLIKHMLCILTVIWFYWLNDEKNAFVHLSNLPLRAMRLWMNELVDPRRDFFK